MSKRQAVLTVAEANARLPLVQAIVRDIRPLFADLADRKDRFADLRAHRRRARREKTSRPERYDEEIAELEKEIDRLVTRFEGYADELREADAYAADPAEGVVEFRGRLAADAEVVWLGWTDGDAAVSYWRPKDSEPTTRLELEPAVAGRPDDPQAD